MINTITHLENSDKPYIQYKEDGKVIIWNEYEDNEIKVSLQNYPCYGVDDQHWIDDRSKGGVTYNTEYTAPTETYWADI